MLLFQNTEQYYLFAVYHDPQKVTLTDTDRELLSEAKKLIDKDVSIHYTITEIARHVGVSESKLTKGFRVIYKAGLFEYLENMRLDKGRELLETTHKSLKQISACTGYRHPNNFITAFKKKYGTTPGKWKVAR